MRKEVTCKVCDGTGVYIMNSEFFIRCPKCKGKRKIIVEENNDE